MTAAHAFKLEPSPPPPPPEPPRRCSERKRAKLLERDLAVGHREERLQGRARALWGRTVFKMFEAADREKKQRPSYTHIPELLFEFPKRAVAASLIPLALLGWVAFAWVTGKKGLYATHAELARMVGCSVGSVRRWMGILSGWGWITTRPIYVERYVAPGNTQLANLYCPGLFLWGALRARLERARRAAAAVDPGGAQPGAHPLAPVVLPSGERQSRSDAPARDPWGSGTGREGGAADAPAADGGHAACTAKDIRRPLGASQAAPAAPERPAQVPLGLQSEPEGCEGKLLAELELELVASLTAPIPYPGRTALRARRSAEITGENWRERLHALGDGCRS